MVVSGLAFSPGLAGAPPSPAFFSPQVYTTAEMAERSDSEVSPQCGPQQRSRSKLGVACEEPRQDSCHRPDPGFRIRASMLGRGVVVHGDTTSFRHNVPSPWTGDVLSDRGLARSVEAAIAAEIHDRPTRPLLAPEALRACRVVRGSVRFLTSPGAIGIVFA
jgi:hypothetical protein